MKRAGRYDLTHLGGLLTSAHRMWSCSAVSLESWRGWGSIIFSGSSPSRGLRSAPRAAQP